MNNLDIIRGIMTLDGKSLDTTDNAGYVYGFRGSQSVIRAVKNMDLRIWMQETFGILRNSRAMPWIETAKDHLFNVELVARVGIEPTTRRF